MAVKKKLSKKPAPKKKSTPTKATTYSTGKTRTQINKEKADMIRRGYGASQPTKRDARKGRKATSKIAGRKTITIKKNESTFIPINTKHRLENPTQEILKIIEVQSGSYLGEDDIQRFEDNYGRSDND